MLFMTLYAFRIISVHKTLNFMHFLQKRDIRTDRRNDGRTDRRTNGRTHLKNGDLLNARIARFRYHQIAMYCHCIVISSVYIANISISTANFLLPALTSFFFIFMYFLQRQTYVFFKNMKKWPHLST